VDDLQGVLAKNPADPLKPKVRQKMYEALTGLLQVDFDNASTRYLDEYKDLCKVPGNTAEEEQRTAQYLRILGQGREAQGNLVEAFKAYREFGSLPSFTKDGVPSIENPAEKIPTNVWLRARVSSLLASAKDPGRKKRLEDRI